MHKPPKALHEDDPISMSILRGRTSYYSILRSRSLATAATSEATTELGLEVAGGTALALLASITAAVTVTVTASAAAATTALTVVTTEHATRGSVGALLLDVRLGHDLSRKVEPLAEVVETLGGEGVVVVLPREAGLDETAGVKRLHWEMLIPPLRDMVEGITDKP